MTNTRRSTRSKLSRRARWLILLVTSGAALPWTASESRATETTLVSTNLAGLGGNCSSSYPRLSANGHVVVFRSCARDLVPNDPHSLYDAYFVRDLETGTTTRLVETGQVEYFPNTGPSLSRSGRFVAFDSLATDPLLASILGHDVFIRDLKKGTTTQASVDSAGSPGDRNSFSPSLSADGRFVAFTSEATNLVPNDVNSLPDVFVHDRRTGNTRRVSVDSLGNAANGASFAYALSANARMVLFSSRASNLVANDRNGCVDFFVHDRKTGATARVSVDSAGAEANADSEFASLWQRIPLDDETIARRLGCTRQQVINLRMAGRKRLSNRLRRRTAALAPPSPSANLRADSPSLKGSV